MLTTFALLEEIDKFLAETGMSDGAFGRAVCDNSKLLPRLREGLRKGTGDLKNGKVLQILAFMKARRREAAE